MVELIHDPVLLYHAYWPHSTIYDKQAEILWAAKNSVETYVVAGNELGKDYILGRLCLMFFDSPWTFFPEGWFDQVEGREEMRQLARARGCRVTAIEEYVLHQRRVVTTSVKDEHLNVLWGEIGTAWRTSAVDFSRKYVMTHHEIRFKEEADLKNASSYMVGKVSGSENMEGLTGHHAWYNLAALDECSGMADAAYNAVMSWARRFVAIGNPLPCQNFYRKNFRAGDLMAADEPVIR